MSERPDARTPFVLGKPIKNPSDFYGREEPMRRLFDAVISGQLVSVVGEHRCGNTSVLYQLAHPEVRERYLGPDGDKGLVFAFVSAQLASDGPKALLRRIARSLRRADPDAGVPFDGPLDKVWLENYLEDLTDRAGRLVLLLDEFEVLAGFEAEFWDWFEKIVTEYDVAVIVSSRMDLGQFRSERRIGPPFFNMFRSLYIGSFSQETFDAFLKEKSEITDFDFGAVRDVICDLAGRFPYYVQVAAALFYLHAGGDSHVDAEQVELVRDEFRSRTGALFADAWEKLPASERDALTWLVFDVAPPDTERRSDREARKSLERRGYLLDGRVFSSAFADHVRAHSRLISLNESSQRIRVGTEVVQPTPDAFALLQFLAASDHGMVADRDIAQALFPDLAERAPERAIDRVRDAVAELRDALDDPAEQARFVEELEGRGIHGYRFVNEPMATPEA